MGLGGQSTQDIERCKLSARAVGLICNWWRSCVREGDAQDIDELDKNKNSGRKSTRVSLLLVLRRQTAARQSGAKPVPSSLVSARARATIGCTTLHVLCTPTIFQPDGLHAQGRAQSSLMCR